MTTWIEWKHAMVRYADDHPVHVKIPSDFHLWTNRCGPACVTLIKEIQKFAGLQVDGILGPRTEAVLAPYLVSAVLRGLVVQAARYFVARRWEFTYDAVRPLGLGWSYRRGDCSWFVVNTSYVVNAPDPAGYHYAAVGNSSSFFWRYPHVALGDLLPGDLIDFGAGGGLHVALVTEHDAGGNPMIAQFGGPGQPQEYRLSVELPYHPGQAITGLRRTDI